MSTMGIVKRQRVRGPSFRREYLGLTTSEYHHPKQEQPPTPRARRSPSLKASLMIHAEDDERLIPPKDPSLKDRITVVLDLDETLIYAREGPLYARPGTDELMRFLAENCETVVWTAGVKSYAKAVIRTIDSHNAVQHIVYRHRKWFSGACGYIKDLRMLGRDMSSTLIVENTPDCIRGFEANGILVADYEGGELEDFTVPAMLALLRDLVEQRRKNGVSVPEYIKTSAYLSRQQVPTDSGDLLPCQCLNATHSPLVGRE